MDGSEAAGKALAVPRADRVLVDEGAGECHEGLLPVTRDCGQVGKWDDVGANPCHACPQTQCLSLDSGTSTYQEFMEKEVAKGKEHLQYTTSLRDRCSVLSGCALGLLATCAPSYLNIASALACAVPAIYGYVKSGNARLAQAHLEEVKKRGLRTFADDNHPSLRRMPISPMLMSLDDALDGFYIRVNCLCQFGYFIWYSIKYYFVCEQPTEHDLIHYALNSSALLYFQMEKRNGAIYLSLNHDDWLTTFFEKDKNHPTNVKINIRIPVGNHDLRGATLDVFEFDQMKIRENSEKLLILSMFLASVIHPQIHSFGNNLFDKFSKLCPVQQDTWRDLVRYGQFLNNVAHQGPAVTIGLDRDDLHQVFIHNVRKPIPVHGESLRELMPYSPYVDFAMKMRFAVKSLVRAYDVPFDPGHIFLTLVMHSLDHVTTGWALRYKHLHTKQFKSQRYPHAENIMWYLPTESTPFNNLLKNIIHKHDFYRALYNRALQINPTYAKHLSVSISY